jgi:SAM-dependent methyltransferase
MRPDLSVRGLDVLLRRGTHISVEIYDGLRIPFDDGSFDWVLFSDVLHHTENAKMLLREARRVASEGVLIKDHYRKGFASVARLRCMDWVGNRHCGVGLPYNFWSGKQWRAAWKEIGLKPERLVSRLGLYPVPVDWIFGARLHFVARLTKCVPSPLPAILTSKHAST